jgi:palmitoyltransferase
MLTSKGSRFLTYLNVVPILKKQNRTILNLGKFLSLLAFQITSFVYIYFDLLIENDIPPLIYLGSVSFCLVIFLIISFMDPGYQQKRNESLLELIKTHSPMEICPFCNCAKFPRSRHCDICKRCVLVFDHHCPWINNCVSYFSTILILEIRLALEIIVFSYFSLPFYWLWTDLIFISLWVAFSEKWKKWIWSYPS